MFERRSALAGVWQTSHRRERRTPGAVALAEVRGWSLVQIAAFGKRSTELGESVRSVLAAPLPERIGNVVRVQRRRLFKIGPCQYWVLAAESDCPAAALLATVAPTTGAVTRLSHSRTCISVAGAAARELLSKGLAVDLHPEVFRLDQFSLTGLHHTPILIHRSDELRYDLYVMRTFALSVWEWIVDAALPLGHEFCEPLEFANMNNR